MPPINAEKRYIPALRNRGVREDRKSLMSVAVKVQKVVPFFNGHTQVLLASVGKIMVVVYPRAAEYHVGLGKYRVHCPNIVGGGNLKTHLLLKLGEIHYLPGSGGGGRVVY